MSKITRRFFLGATGLLLVMPWKWNWVEARAAGARARVTSWRLRYRRWRYGIQPRWVDWKNTNVTRYRDDTAHQVVTEWRDLRWPDNDEVVRREDQGGSGQPVDHMEWFPNEAAIRPPESFKGVFYPGELERWAAMVEPGGKFDGLTGERPPEERFAWDCKRTLEIGSPRPFTDEERAILEPAAELDARTRNARREDMLPTAFRLVEGDPRGRSFTEEELAFLEPALERTRAIVEHEKRHPWVPGRGPAQPWFVHRIGEWLFPKS